MQVGAPPAIASLLDEIQKENESSRRGGVSSVVGADPELDEFMVFAFLLQPDYSLSVFL